MNCPKCGNPFEDNIGVCPSCGDYFNVLKKADVKKRIISDVVDASIVILLFFINKYLLILGMIYIIFRDNISKKGSIGKIITGLNIVDINKKVRANFKQRIARNIFNLTGLLLISVLYLFEFIFLIGFVFSIIRISVFVLFSLFIAIEIYRIYNDENGQTLSDSMAKTIIV